MLTDSSALHSSLLRIIQEEPEPQSFPRWRKTAFQGIDPISLTHQKLVGENLTVLADTAVETFGSAAMKQCNKTLKAWRRAWDHHRVHNQETRARPFSTDPLPFWYLAKMYQALYLSGEVFASELNLKLPMRRGSHDRWKTEEHERIIAWLDDFREQSFSKERDLQESESMVTDEASCALAKLMKPM